MKSGLVAGRLAGTTAYLLRERQQVGLGSEEEECGGVLQRKALVRRLLTACNLVSVHP
jgi:hypothetical protein